MTYRDELSFNTVSSSSANAVSALNEKSAKTPPVEKNWPPAAMAKLAQGVVNDFNHWKRNRGKLEYQWKECWEAYLCDVKALYVYNSTLDNDRSRVARPILYESVEAIHAHLLNGLFPANEKFFTVVGKTEQDYQHRELIEQFLRHKLEESDFIEKYALFLKQAIIMGNSIAAVPWKTLTESRTVEKPLEVFGLTVGYHTVEEDVVQYNGPDFEVLDMFDVVLDPNAPNFQQAKLIRQVKRSLSELRENPAYHHLEELAGHNPETGMADTHKQSRRRAFGLEQETRPLPETDEPTFQVLEAWGDFWVEDTLYKNYLCVVAGQTVIRFEPNPYPGKGKPFVFTNFIPVPNELYGIGAIEKSVGLQHAINTLTNQKLDVINLSINSPFTYLINDDVFDPGNMVTRPGALIPVKSHDTLRPIQYLNNFTVAFQEIETLKAEIQEATGALKYFTGGESAKNRTATEVSALVNGGSQKFSSTLSHLEKTSLAPFLHMVFSHAQQFIYQPEMLQYRCNKGEMQFRPLCPDLLKRAQCGFKIDGSKGVLLKEQELEALASFIALAEKSPTLQSQINLSELYKKIYRRLGFTDELEIFIPSPTLTVQEETLS
jgi:hypothetical protein